MAVGTYIYVGKSRVRKLNRERRKKRALERRKDRPASGGSPDVGRYRYCPLPSSPGSDHEDLSLEYDAELDSSSTGSSELEDLLPLIDLDSALDLRPHFEKHSPSLKMPFDLFKRKEKKKQNKNDNEKAEVKGEINEDFKPETNDIKQEEVTSEESNIVKKEQEEQQPEETPEPEVVPEPEPENIVPNEAIGEEEKPTTELKAIEEVIEKPKEPVKEEVISEKAIEVQSNGKPTEQLILEKNIVDDTDDASMGLVCCTIL